MPRTPPTDLANGTNVTVSPPTGISIFGNGDASATANVCSFCGFVCGLRSLVKPKYATLAAL